MSVELVRVEMKVNGKTVCRTIPPSMRLADFLRDELHLIGTKKGCNAGECGTCSVLIDGVLKKSCLIPAVKADHCEIVTIEGIGTEGLSVIQRCFVKVGAVQCGYCTPGMLMSAVACINLYGHPTREQIRKEMEGNICRCTGYTRIADAILLAVEKLDALSAPAPGMDPDFVETWNQGYQED